jgi:hypothetical protein
VQENIRRASDVKKLKEFGRIETLIKYKSAVSIYYIAGRLNHV